MAHCANKRALDSTLLRAKKFELRLVCAREPEITMPRTSGRARGQTTVDAFAFDYDIRIRFCGAQPDAASSAAAEIPSVPTIHTGGR